jgi:DNA processing protein
MLIGQETQSSSMEADIPYWLAISQRSSAFTASLIARAIARFGTLEKMWNSSEDALSTIGFTETSISHLRKLKRDFQINEFWKQADQITNQEVQIIRFIDKKYPAQLKAIRTVVGPPIMIFCKGNHLSFDNAAAIVGTRNCSFHGRSMARQLSKKLADNGHVIVSGLARGVDEEAHCGALESKNGNTLAVLAWFDPIYPAEHSELIKDIENRGARVSENYTKSFGSMTGGKFVERNRITSGIANVVIAIESDADGGTIRQLELANQQGKPIFILKPNGNQRAWRGFNHIVENLKGIPFSDAEELMDHLKAKKLEPPKLLSNYTLDSQERLI